jgi:hypothetical protein
MVEAWYENRSSVIRAVIEKVDDALHMFAEPANHEVILLNIVLIFFVSYTMNAIYDIW